ncbi:MAG: glutamate synthase small chain, partial [Campylobacterota bacterium]|nr:glutamate synthase small chain [Campylobacterota bacterium]
SFKISNESSPFPEILGRICPQDKLCEGACTLNEDGYGAITIGSIETAITERGFEAGFELDFPGVTSDKKVAVIGSGPAGFSAANFLLRAGIKVVMFEKDSVAGGLLTWGIPGFKLEKEVVQKRFEILKKAGLDLRLNCEIGKDISFESIKKDYDAVFIGVGASRSNSLGLKNENTSNVVNAIDFLRDVQSKLFKFKEATLNDIKGKSVLVIGGGDTAMDCVRTSLREGARSVKCIYRRDEANMPGSKKEFINANEEGVEFIFLASPKAINVKNEKATSVTFVKMLLAEKDSSGRQKTIEVDGSEFDVEADLIIMSLGFSHQEKEFLKGSGIKLDKWGGFEVGSNCETSLNLVYAGGDCIRGADLAVTAARDGRVAAFNIINRLLK